MSCKYKLDIVRLKQESWKGLKVTFNIDISDDEFEYNIRKRYSKTTNQITTDDFIVKDGANDIIIGDPEIEEPGTYVHELIRIHDGFRKLVFQGVLVITNNACQKTCIDVYDTDVDNNEEGETIEVTFDETYVQINLDYNSLTPEQKAELKGDPFVYEDFTPAQIQDIKQPALDAAQVANTAAQNANEAADNANDAAQTANTAAQNADDKVQELTEAVHNAKWYGIEWDVTNSSPDVTRIGDLALHRTLPLQSRMVGALVGDDRKVVEYLSPNDWDAHDLTGARGQVMVRIPEHYYKFETDGNIRRAKISEYPLPGFHHFKSVWHGAYPGTIYRPDNKLCSVANFTADYRGGFTGAEKNEFLGMARTSVSRTNVRSYARNRGAEWNQVWYNVRKQLFWLFAIEYATFHSQKAVNTALDSNGFRQGGLGDGVTTVASADWIEYNDRYPFVPFGTTNALGNGSGEVAYELPEEFPGNTRVVYTNRYRGIENPFGEIYEWVDGVNIQIQADDEGDGVSSLWVCDDPELFQDVNYDNYEMRGLLPRANGYIREVLFGEHGDILPLINTGAGSTTYFTDQFYTNIPASGEALRGLFSGGDASRGASAGLDFSDSTYAPASTGTYRGFRLCCEENVSAAD